MNSCGDLGMTDWDDYRYFLAVAEEGSLSAAANRLRASQPTVGRRIASLEDRLEVRLFERHPRGYSPTPAGEAILDLARRLDSNVRDIGLRIKGQDTEFVGTVSISTPESMAVYWLIPRLSRLRRLHPGIRIEVHSAAAIADIARGEADLALRFDRPGDDDVLLARKVGRARFGLYAAARYLQRHGTPLALEDLNRHAVIGPAGRPAGRYADRRMARSRREFRGPRLQQHARSRGSSRGRPRNRHFTPLHGVARTETAAFAARHFRGGSRRVAAGSSSHPRSGEDAGGHRLSGSGTLGRPNPVGLRQRRSDVNRHSTQSGQLNPPRKGRRFTSPGDRRPSRH